MMGDQSGGTSRPGHGLYTRTWRPAGRPRASLALVHGFGEHGDLYDHFAQYFTGRGYVVFVLDLRGHGRSAGPRGFIERWSDYREDTGSLVAMAREETGGAPCFLVGNSMGGLIAVEYALHHPGQLRGVVAMAPALGEIGVSPLLMGLSRMLSRVWPRFSLDTRLDSEAMTRDPEVVARLDADPLVHGTGTARLGTEITATIAWVREHAGDLAVPLLLLHGEADRITEPDGTRRFYELVRNPDKTLLTYPGAYHNLIVDLNWREVLDDIAAWIEPRAG